MKGSECPYCHKWFRTSLKQHIAEVHRQNHYSCDTCDKVFDTKRSLTRHQKLVHKEDKKVEDSQKSVPCKVCGIHVLSRKLASHIEIHHLLPEKFSVPCPLCPTIARFLPYHINSAHSKVNIRRELYPCRKCSRYFLSCTDLNAHEKNHQEYPCSLCQQSYDRFLDLGWHYLNHHNLVYNPCYRASRAKKTEYLQEITKLQLYSFQSCQRDHKDDIYKEIEVDVGASERGQVDKVLVYIPAQSDQLKAKNTDTAETSVTHLDNPTVEDDSNVQDHEDLHDPEPLNDVTSDLNDLIKDQNYESVSTERCKVGRTDNVKDNTDAMKDNTDIAKDAAQPDCDESEEMSLIETESYIVIEEDCSYEMENRIEINANELIGKSDQTFNLIYELNNSKKSPKNAANDANDINEVVHHDDVREEHDNRQVTTESVVEIPEEMMIVHDDIESDSTIQIITEEIAVGSNTVTAEENTFSMIGQVLIPNNNEFILCYNENEVESGDPVELIEADSSLFTSVDIESSDSTRVADFSHEEERIRQVFKSKADVPRDAKGLTFNSSENKIFSELTKVGIKNMDLNKLQINMKPNKSKSEEKNNKTRHKYSDNRQAHVCPHCKNILKTRHSLKTHIIAKHSDNKPFSCDICDRTFPARWNLKKHKEISHEKIEMVECDICKNLFKASYIKRHRDATHGPKTATNCDICGNIFVSRQVMLQHKRRLHK